MTWLAAIVKGLAEALFGWGQKQAEKPKQTTDAKTPDSIKRGWRDYVNDKLRNPDGGGDRP